MSVEPDDLVANSFLVRTAVLTHFMSRLTHPQPPMTHSCGVGVFYVLTLGCAALQIADCDVSDRALVAGMRPPFPMLRPRGTHRHRTAAKSLDKTKWVCFAA